MPILTIENRYRHEVKEYVTLDFVYEAYRDCCKHKGSTESCMEYTTKYIAENYLLYKELNGMTYTIGESKAFCVTKPTLREVFCAKFRDRIVHHLLALKFGDMLDGELTDRAYACRKGKGTDYGINDVRAQIEQITDGYKREAWILKCDLQGFFMSIDRMLLYRLLERTIRERYDGDDIEWWLWLWKLVVLHDPTKNCVKVGDLNLWSRLPKNKSLFTCGEGKGLPIGNLPSQLLANLLLADFDREMINRLGSSGGYGRYVDDFVAIHPDRRLLHTVLQWARGYLHTELGLTLHPRKISLQRASSGVSFTGTMIRKGRLLPNKRTVEHLYHAIDEFGIKENPQGEELIGCVNHINSLFGLFVHRNTYNIRRKAWCMMPHKDRVYCVNMKKIKINNKHK